MSIAEICSGFFCRVSCDKAALNMDYLPHLRQKLTRPLVDRAQEGVREVVDLLGQYDLQKDDFDTMMEVTQWSGRPDPMSKVESKVRKL